MSFPIMNSRPTYTLNIPEMSGGMNLRDGLSGVADNQLTDCKNVWFKDGCLRTRPKVGSYTYDKSYLYASSYLSDGGVNVYADPEHIVRSQISEREYNFAVVVASEFVEGQGDTTKVKFLFFTGKAATGEANSVTVGERTWSNKVIDNVLTIQFNGEFYSFVSGHDMDAEDTAPTRLGLFCSNIDGISKFHEVEDDYIHQPTVIINSKPSADESEGVTGTAVYSHNILSGYYKMTCTLPEAIEGELDTYFYTLPLPVSYSDKNGKGYFAFDYTSGKTVKAVITYSNGDIATHEVFIGRSLEGYGFMEGNQSDINGVANSVDGLIMCVRNKTVCFYNSSKKLVCPTVGVVIPNNMVITAPKEVKDEDVMKIYSMTRSIWYGGTADGLYGGTRLFLGGNTASTDRALMMWSDLNNPLYFPEYNYAYVGDASKALTAFGRQGESLVLLKDRELLQVPYIATADITVEQLESQTVIDLASQSIIFPIYTVHGYIGCDCPDTVQLCRNRLVWANSDGKVYSLITQNQYNERAVFSVSEMIENRLSKHNLKAAFSADWNGYYCLIVGKSMYLMDYNSYGFNYASSFSKLEDANIKIPWFYWELPVSSEALTVNNGHLMMIAYHETSGEYNFGIVLHAHYMDGSYGKDELCEFTALEGEYSVTVKKADIEAFIQTKLFNFGQPARLKSVPVVNFSFGYNDSYPIAVKFISEKQIADEHEIVIEGEDAEKTSPEYIHSKRLFPYTKGTVSFGARITCNGELSIHSMSLQYKALGGAK